MSPCSTPLAWETLVAYWSADLSEAETERVDEHLMACVRCSEHSARVAQLAQSLRELLPPVLAPALLDTLHARGLCIEDNPMSPGERREVTFPRHVDILLHRLQGLELSDVVKVDFSVHDEASGNLLTEVHDAPFDRARGEVLVACQKHYASFPPNTVFEITAALPSGETRSTRYTVLHRFA
ncbi:MAG: zf-HC2 domain-containing protein [Myxococcales bacterium]